MYSLLYLNHYIIYLYEILFGIQFDIWIVSLSRTWSGSQSGILFYILVGVWFGSLFRILPDTWSGIWFAVCLEFFAAF